MAGWISLHRKIQEHPFFQEKRSFSKFEAWVDLLLMANHKESKVLLGNEMIKIERGSFITSELKLMDRWSWSKTKVRSFLKLLEDDEMIIKNTDKKKTTITICNYTDYQKNETTKEPQTNHYETTEKPQKDTNNNVNNINNFNKEIDKETSRKNAFQIFESEGFGTISSFIAEMLGSLIDDFGEERVIQAMKETRVNGSTSLNYTKSILINQNKKRGMNNASNSRTSSGISPEESARISETNERRKRLAGIESGRNSHYSF
ncbi:DnaD domain-containing protein [Paenisporosarcina cavernae]|uniref:DnaD domain protein n=1 Tax=Paenisporosarcina cavernae TaxID=2320858 RepID=A0A385YPN7_9BACL|nr:DnaD domain protein [Paenisporosarcina cavernae]AYC28699.1 DnaD domain protein [Paenisporosarcina cavernae]